MHSYKKNRVNAPSAETIASLKDLAHKLLAELELAEREQSGETNQQFDFYEEVRRFEIQLITRALHHSEGHQLEAAQWINLNPSTLNAKIKQYNIQVNAFSRSIGNVMH